MKYESFAELVNLIHLMKIETDRFNDSMDSLLGEDTRSFYIEPLCIVERSIIQILMNDFNETKEGAEWFVYEGLSQIKSGGTSIEENGKIWNIKTIRDYYDYLNSLQE